MKRIICLVLMLGMMLVTICGIAEESAIDKLSDVEKQIYNALLVMLDDFYNPSAVRVLELRNYNDYSKYREYTGTDEAQLMLAKPDNVVVRLSGENRLGGTLNKYYLLCLSNWTTPKSESVRNMVTSFQKIGMSVINYVGKIGDYEELDSTDYRINGFALSDYMVGNINRALKEHWDILGF